ncbi:leukocyte-associated immunoglobulin-like receptor 1 isoform X2 [Phyllostomus hastatus]|uniref:leukocyte-associated immunoglobulin-like receptor 1 isoform X2 n=1 Tax=Phyllostomus hastatus TaxID=9423 RepID=UPI001E6844CE|nr:leukocyte-associated immunoglobulin-like receptor 1 isoform X2 [Phyllostomus hastatus]
MQEDSDWEQGFIPLASTCSDPSCVTLRNAQHVTRTRGPVSGGSLCSDEDSQSLEFLPKPSIRAEPGPVIPQGQPVTVMCQGPAGADGFLLEKNGTSFHWGERNVSQHGAHWTEGTFHIDSMNELTAGSYWCHCLKGPRWSECSEPLELKVTDKDVSTPSSGSVGTRGSVTLVGEVHPPLGTTPEVTPRPTGEGSQSAPTSWNYMVENFVCIGLSGVVLLILVVILAEVGHSWHRCIHGPQGWTQGRSR